MESPYLDDPIPYLKHIFSYFSSCRSRGDVERPSLFLRNTYTNTHWNEQLSRHVAWDIGMYEPVAKEANRNDVLLFKCFFSHFHATSLRALRLRRCGALRLHYYCVLRLRRLWCFEVAPSVLRLRRCGTLRLHCLWWLRLSNVGCRRGWVLLISCDAMSWAVDDETKISWKMHVGVLCNYCRNFFRVDVSKSWHQGMCLKMGI